MSFHITRGGLLFVCFWSLVLVAFGDDANDALPKACIDGTGPGWVELGLKDFENANCDPDTFTFKDGVISCTGKPIGVTRSKKEYKNFEMVAQWKHLQKAGNSGIFVWVDPESIATLGRGKYPKGIEIQVLDIGYTEAYEKSSGKKATWFTTHGDLIQVSGATFKPFEPTSPDGSRSFPRKQLSKPAGEWNHYYVRCINGEIRLWVNGEEVSGCNDTKPSSGYICLESEGAPIEFRQIRVRELP
jgi:hypothetical protein